ncbi:MAG: hypothetical protein WCF88_16775, partial [Candidatus Acidiferrales bacterium]
ACGGRFAPAFYQPRRTKLRRATVRRCRGQGFAGPDRAERGASNSKTRGKGTAKGMALRAVFFSHRFRAGLAYAAPPALVGWRDVSRARTGSVEVF